MIEQCSELFSNVFDSHSGGAVRTCVCGRTFFDYTDPGCFDAGELLSLEAKSKAEPDKYFPVDHTIGTFSIGGAEIVDGCPCDTAAQYERFIVSHALSLAEYLRRYAAALQEKAANVYVPNAATESLQAELGSPSAQEDRP